MVAEELTKECEFFRSMLSMGRGKKRRGQN